MTSLVPNLVKRIERLPKPTNATTALQPLFEAISNAIHSTQGKYGDAVSQGGRVDVNVVLERKKDAVAITVEDNGFGLDAKNFKAFQTTDTDNKIAYGGKGVGRLLWLDCFQRVYVESVFDDGGQLKRRNSILYSR
jgi:light-regulated signal transduction histidine kinase (bacteriophytochrome)